MPRATAEAAVGASKARSVKDLDGSCLDGSSCVLHMDTVCVTPDIMVTIVTCRTIHFSYTHAMVIVAEDVPVLMHLTSLPRQL